ncbi:restriction endonuclease [Paenibacillus sp. LMG 31456]|uniref:Restriction endonuclease n=1 Tax=Paenibacillus foliorum TaxID=2654974 RepID=A0A972GVB6_9BACL|nr:HNH endonuclease [Paenibacillus foliorum]NOU94878.1 restriction endonuclease [Paenibacillus foliorum]
MNADGLKNNLTIWKKNGQRAPHKPLLLLYALGRLQHNETSLPYEQVRLKLKKLLTEFGPSRKSYHPEEPFVRLETDGIWKLTTQVDKANFSDKQLLTNRVAGGFTNEVLSLLKGNDFLIQEIAVQIVNEHFPETMQQDIFDEAGLDFSMKRKRPRDPHFRDKILRAYEYSCAICGFDVLLGHNLVAIDAAHIQWHQAGGPDSEENGIALCSLHHKLFDRGVSSEREMLVAEEAHGSVGFEEWLMRFHGKKVRSPIHPIYQPNDSFIGWHIKEVFRGPARFNQSGGL